MRLLDLSYSDLYFPLDSLPVVFVAFLVDGFQFPFFRFLVGSAPLTFATYAPPPIISTFLPLIKAAVTFAQFLLTFTPAPQLRQLGE